MTDSISIPGYRVTRQLGQGGMATVYLAIQESFDREIALKVMSPFLNSDPSFATRFLREARIVSQIHHSSIVPVMDVGQHEGHHYLCMEFLPGGDLKERITEGRHGVALALNVCVAISSALDLAHRKGFVHRDIKPENILFREDGTPVLTDFGIARAIEDGTQLTMVGTMVGTPNYMSPEQVKGGDLDGRSDLYSLGVVFFEMLTGLVPFRADSTMTLAMKHLTEPLPQLPPEFAIYQPFLDRLMAKEREDRFASGAEVIRALRLITDMAIARESTLVRRLNLPQQGMDMPTLVAPAPSAEPLYTSTAADPSNVIRVPHTSTQPSGIMKIPGFAAQPSGTHPAELPPGGSIPATLPAADLAPQSALDAQSDLTVPRPAAAQPAAQSPPKPKPFVERRAAVPLPVRARTLLQQVLASRQSSLIAVGAIAVIAIGMGFLLGRTTDSSEPIEATLAATPRGTNEAARMAAISPPSQRQSTPVSTTAPTRVDRGAFPVAADSANADLDGQPASDNDDAETRAAKEEAQRKAEEERKRLAEVKKQQQQERLEAKRALEEEQRNRNLQVQRDKEAKIRGLLSTAKDDIAGGRLTTPAGNNAAERYREVLSSAPAKAEELEARNGLKRVAGVLVQEAYRALANGNKDSAVGLIDNVKLVQSDHPELGKLQARLEAAEPVKGGISRSQQISRDRAIEKCRTILARTPMTLDVVNSALKEYDRAQQISTVAQGLSILGTRFEEALIKATQTEMGNGNTKQARKLIDIARARQWMTPELEQLEQGMDAAKQSAGSP